MNITKEQQRKKYETDKRYHMLEDDAEAREVKPFNQSCYLLRNRFGFYFEYRKLREIINLLNCAGIKLRDKKILDVGCHRGLHLNFIAILKDSSEDLYGVDFVQDYIKRAKGINNNINFTQQDLYEGLNFEDEYFDLIMVIYFFNSIPEKDHRMIAETISKKLRQGGYILIFDLYKKDMLGKIGNFISRRRGEWLFPCLNDKAIRKMFPDFKIINSKSFINILTPRLINFLPYPLVELLDFFIPHCYYIALLKKV